MYLLVFIYFFFFFNDPATTEIYTLSLHDALPISRGPCRLGRGRGPQGAGWSGWWRGGCVREECRSEEHTSELQSRFDLVCRLLLEKKKKTIFLHVISITYSPTPL